MSRKVLTFFIALFSLTLFSFFRAASLPALAQDTGWEITNFDSHIAIEPDTSVAVTETIQVDFHDLEKHGIFRTIPVKYQTRWGNNLDIKFRLLTVTDAAGNALPVQTAREGKSVKLKIGDPDQLITGPQTYTITYQVNRVITTPNGTAELYWNATGTDWPVPILAAQVTVTVPEDSLADTICFKDYFGQSSQNCTAGHTGNQAQFTAASIASGQGLTIALALDKSGFTFPLLTTRILWILEDNIFYFLPLITFVLMFYLYWTRGRDKQYKSLFHDTEGVETVPLFQKLSIPHIYAPPRDLSPGEVGVLIDEKVHLQDITAVVIDLARRGYFTITEITKKGLLGKTDYELKLEAKSETGLKDFEISVLDLLFGTARKSPVKLNSLPQNAYQHLSKINQHLYHHLTQAGYFSGNPKTVRTIYLVIGIVLISLSFLVGPMLLSLGAGAAGFAGPILSGLVVIIFSFFMPARSAKGRRALAEVVGLKDWVRLGAWREKIHEKLNLFEEVLPYAIAFGLTQKFIQAFKAADIKDLSWYHGNRPFNAIYFSNSMTNFGHSLNSGIAATQPKSSASSGGSGFSGGSSGGGFGGGGGGSW